MSKEFKLTKATYPKMFWLLIIFSVFGLLLEGTFCYFAWGHWESHVNSIWGPFCLIYGIGAVGYYIVGYYMQKKNIFLQFIVYAIVGDVVEYFCSWLIDYLVGMEAWNYNEEFLNINGRICLYMTFVWGLFGIIMVSFVFPLYDKLYNKISGKPLNIACYIFTGFMIVNMTLTVISIIRWSHRHQGLEPKNSVGIYLDENYPNDFMQKKFCEWKFIR